MQSLDPLTKGEVVCTSEADASRVDPNWKFRSLNKGGSCLYSGNTVEVGYIEKFGLDPLTKGEVVCTIAAIKRSTVSYVV